MIAAQESITAKLCSFARAYHSNTGHKKIFDDYLAYDRMGRDEFERIGQLIQNDFETEKADRNSGFDPELISEKLDRYITPIPISRIAFAEKKLRQFAAEYGECQYVICGAGMDTFAFRNDNPDIRIFELDHPDTGRYKRERIHQLEWNIPGNLTFVSVDFSKDDMSEELLRAGFDPEKPSFFAILGVSYYLKLSVFEQTIKKIGELSRPPCKIVFDYPDETTLKNQSTERVQTLADITEKLGEKMLHGYSFDEIKEALKNHGFDVEEHETPVIIQQRYFRNSNIKAFENINFILASNDV